MSASRQPKGQALVEFALLATFVITLLLGIVDFGRAYYTQVQIKNAVGDAGYFAIQNPQNRTGTKAAIKRQLGNLTQANLTINITCSSGITNVKVSYQYDLLFSWIMPSAQVTLGDETYVPQVDGCPSSTF